MNIYAGFHTGTFVGANDNIAINYYSKAANLGDLEAMNNYYKLVRLSKDPKDEIIDKYEKDAQKGDMIAIKYCAIIYRTGYGGITSDEKYRNYVKMAADKGDTQSMVAYAESRTFSNEYKIYIKKAADKNDIEGIKKYAYYLTKEDRYTDAEIITDLYYKAAIKGDAEGLFCYGYGCRLKKTLYI